MVYILKLIDLGYRVEGKVRTIEGFAWGGADCCWGSFQWEVTGCVLGGLVGPEELEDSILDEFDRVL